MPEEIDEFATEARVEELQKLNAKLQRDLRRAKDRSADLVAATLQGSRDAMTAFGPIRPVPKPKLQRGKGKEEVALWDMGDWQGAKRTTSYNSQVMRERVEACAMRMIKITEMQRSAHPVRNATIIFGGDMVEGLWNFPTQAHEIDQTIFGQYTTVSRLLVDTVRIALSAYEHVTVVPEWGNHGRMGSKRDAVPRSDNVDRMCYELARQLLEDEPRITWDDCPEDIQRVEIGNYRALAIHGDEIGRNGYASPNALVSWVVRQKSGAYPWPFRDVYSHHYHTHAEYPLPDGSGALYQTGSTESDNRYAGVMMAASAIPSQRLHFIDPNAGRVTGQFKVWLS